MKAGMTLGLLFALGACERGNPPPESPPATAASAAVAEPSEPVGDAPKAELVYKRALDRARKELTADNAADRLREIEREVDREIAEGS